MMKYVRVPEDAVCVDIPMQLHLKSRKTATKASKKAAKKPGAKKQNHQPDVRLPEKRRLGVD